MLNLNRKRLSRAIWDTLFDGLEDLPWQRIDDSDYRVLAHPVMPLS